MRDEATRLFIQLASSRRERNSVIAKSDEFFAARGGVSATPQFSAPWSAGLPATLRNPR
jgi:hypothetical protein